MPCESLPCPVTEAHLLQSAFTDLTYHDLIFGAHNANQEMVGSIDTLLSSIQTLISRLEEICAQYNHFKTTAPEIFDNVLEKISELAGSGGPIDWAVHDHYIVIIIRRWKMERLRARIDAFVV